MAGLWLRFEDGWLLRLLMTVTSAIFGWLVMDVALQARDATHAVGRAIGLSVIFGMASTLAPSIVISSHDHSMPFVACLICGAIFGSMTGLVYGFVLAIVAGATWRHVDARTHDGADRAVRIASFWSLVPMLLIAWVVVGYDLHHTLSEWASERERDAQLVAVPLGILGLGAAMLVTAASFAMAQARLLRRRRWLLDVSLGRDARWAVREIGPHDDVPRLPRLREGRMVLEHKNELGAYRANATGEAIALV